MCMNLPDRSMVALRSVRDAGPKPGGSPKGPTPRQGRSADEFGGHLVRDDAAGEAQIEQPLHRLGNDLAAIHGVMVHVHADELLGQTGIHVTRELERVIERFLVVVQSVLDALAHQPAAFVADLAGQRAQQDVGPQRQRQVELGLPPGTRSSTL